MKAEDETPIVFDIGASSIRVGYAGSSYPQYILPAIIGNNKKRDPKTEKKDGWCHDYLIGNAAKERSNPSTIHPIFQNGHLSSKEDLDRILKFMYSHELNIESESHPVVVSEPLNNPDQYRQIIPEVFFELYRVPSVYLASSTSLSLFTTSKSTGISVDIGESYTQVSAIYDWTTMPQGVLTSPIAGSKVTDDFYRHLKTLSYRFNAPSMKSTACDLKEQYCYISLGGEEEPAVEHKIAEDSVIQLGSALYKVPEVLFNPQAFHIDEMGVVELVNEVLLRCDIGMREQLVSNIVVSGGTTMMRGFVERMSRDLSTISPNANVVAAPNRKITTWLGGSILGSLALFKPMSISLEEYRESGYSAIKKHFY